MKKTIPFKKQLPFKTNINEITSISLENTLFKKDNGVEGNLIVSGTYKITEASIKVDEFEFKIPVNIEIGNNYNLENIVIDINDFYYEIINSKMLEVNIEVLIDKLEEKLEESFDIIEEPLVEKHKKIEVLEEPEENNRCIEEESKQEYQDINENVVETIFENIETKEQYSTYHIYIVREEDTIESIMSKYNITREELSEYNELQEVKIGDKLIIPEK